MSKPKIIGIDIETYSSEDLSKCGVYRYVEAPDFEILLFAYAFDDDEVEIVDMARGEKLPEEVLSAIDDPKIIRHGMHSLKEPVSANTWAGCFHRIPGSAPWCWLRHFPYRFP